MLYSQDWQTLSAAYAFIGNSLLTPMNQTSHEGADPEFWVSFPDFADGAVRAAADNLSEWARRAGEAGEDAAVQKAAVEHTHLFVGPPKPAAAPWEAFHRGSSEVSVGFGQATYEMRALLREAGLELSGPSNQYEDHMGVELLLLSELCRRAAEAASARRAAGPEAGFASALESEAVLDSGSDQAAKPGLASGSASTAESADELFSLEAQVRTFIEEHPRAWVGRLIEAVRADAPCGYVDGLLGLERALLEWHRRQLA
ncbi:MULTISPECIES: molecular chaperone [unclassified Adlercreutzia]|uniref:TorD/DmsD family molecular chaperone n=1 Tax=unclassified Adlercreutzia TaxID=2636013 RepID=UPI0013EC7179|nr:MULTISPECIES: molecular chaperone TorD family protein [unclassified Adlercreutzia]